MQQGNRVTSRRWLVVGSATVDCIVQGTAAVYKSGGVVVYGGLTLVRSGEPVAVCSNLSARDRDVIEPLEREGVSLHCGESAETTAFVNYVDGDTRRQQMTSVASPIQPHALGEVSAQVQWVLLGPLHPRDISASALSYLAEETTTTICVDMQGFTRGVANGWVKPGIAPQMRAVLAVAHIVKVAHEELDLLLAWAGCNLMELMRMYSVNEVVVTNGSRGGFIRTVAGHEARFSAKEVQNVVDPTGAGDVFFATYLLERLRRESTVEQAAERAAAQAAAQVAGHFIRTDELKLIRPH
ncbi:MAG: sugar/nucleoside kinase (ribokinase family) [Candidatus Latescibacterota bacterium]|jgi:sugar/nucleoside kinase (ribokinase family)